MIDINLIRENPEVIKESQRKRGEDTKLIDKAIRLDKEWREAFQKLNKLKHQRNLVTQKIAELKEKGKSAEEEIKQMRALKEEISELEVKTEKLKQERDRILWNTPNILHESVPQGKDENDNVPIRYWGKKPKFDFKPKDHLSILKDLNLIDTERGAKAAGHQFFYLKNELVLLDLAIMRYAIDHLIKKGYTLVEPPFMIKKEAYQGVTDFEFFEEQIYKIKGEDLYLIATAEHPIAAMYMNEVLLKEDLPLKIVGVSPCFRKEVGAHGKYTKGLFRMHQFNKIEQYIFCLPEDSWRFHEELQKNCEELYQGLGLHYRVVNVCTGDIGTIAAKKYDVEVWMVDGKYREAGSNSNCTDYQARRLNIRYREKEGAPPKGYVHTLNNTALATSRTMIAILEQYQQKDGSVKIPKALWPYLDFKVISKV